MKSHFLKTQQIKFDTNTTTNNGTKAPAGSVGEILTNRRRGEKKRYEITNVLPKTYDTIMNFCINIVKCIDFFWNINASNMTPYLERDVRDNISSEEQKEEGRYGFDSHIDTSYARNHVRIMEIIEGRSCDVYPFNEGHYTSMKKIQ